MNHSQKFLGIAITSLLLPLLSGCNANVGSTTQQPTPAAPVATLTTTTVAFGNQMVSTTSSAQTITLSNTGTASLTSIVISLTGTNPADFADTSACGTTLAAGSSCDILVTFTPASAASFAATLSVADNASGSPQTATLTGTGTITPVPVATLTPSLAFGNQTINTTSAAMTAVLSNTSNTLLTGIVVSLVGANPTDFADTSACGTTLAAGSSCNISVTFTPASVANFTATLSVADNASGSPQTSSLTGTAPPVYSEVNSCTSNEVTSPAQPAPIANYAGATFTGTVQAGSLPVIGSSVQLYSAGATGNGSAPIALLPTPLVSDRNGNFSVSAAFTCPYNTSVIYVVATGGTAGASGAPNAGTVLATVLGTCESVKSGASFVVNEATTVATATAMAPFLSAGGKMGATSTNSLGIALAAATAANLININAGFGPGASFPSNGIAPTVRINSLANALNACIISSGASSNACYQLYAATAASTVTPSNTLDAALNLARNPAANVSALYSLSSASNSYQPALVGEPADWTTFITYSGGGMNSPSAIAIDSVGKVWVANYFSVASLFSNSGAPLFASGISGNNLYESFGDAVDVNDVAWIANEESHGFNSGLGSITVLNNLGASPGTYASGGIDFPLALAFDTSGTLWSADYGDSHVTLLDSTGTPQSGTSGFTSTQLVFPAAIATDSECNAFVANQSSDTITLVTKDGSTFTNFITGSGGSGLAIDPSDYVWVSNFYNSSVGLVSATKGTVLSGDGFTGGGLQQPQGIAADGAGNVWVANYRDAPGASYDSVSELAGVATGNAGTAISPATGYGVDAGMLESFGIAIDAGGSVWVSNFGTDTLTEFVGMATPVKTPLLGPVRLP